MKVNKLVSGINLMQENEDGITKKETGNLNNHD